MMHQRFFFEEDRNLKSRAFRSAWFGCTIVALTLDFRTSSWPNFNFVTLRMISLNIFREIRVRFKLKLHQLVIVSEKRIETKFIFCDFIETPKAMKTCKWAIWAPVSSGAETQLNCRLYSRCLTLGRAFESSLLIHRSAVSYGSVLLGLSRFTSLARNITEEKLSNRVESARVRLSSF